MPSCSAIGCDNRSGEKPILKHPLIDLLKQPSGYLHGQNSNNNTRTRCEICSELRIKTPERHHWRRSGVFIVNFEHNLHLVLVFLLLTLNRQMPIENFHVLANFQVPKFSFSIDAFVYIFENIL